MQGADGPRVQAVRSGGDELNVGVGVIKSGEDPLHCHSRLDAKAEDALTDAKRRESQATQ